MDNDMSLSSLYPGGQATLIRVLPGGNPAVGTSYSTFIPAGKIWKINSFGFKFTTGVAVANRQIEVQLLRGGAGAVFDNFCVEVQAASLGWFYRAANYGQSQPVFFAGVSLVHFIHWPSVIAFAGDQFQINANSIQAADQFDMTANSGCDIEEYLMP
jgi:hypothetical protein